MKVRKKHPEDNSRGMKQKSQASRGQGIAIHFINWVWAEFGIETQSPCSLWIVGPLDKSLTDNHQWYPMIVYHCIPNKRGRVTAAELLQMDAMEFSSHRLPDRLACLWMSRALQGITLGFYSAVLPYNSNPQSYIEHYRTLRNLEIMEIWSLTIILDFGVSIISGTPIADGHRSIRGVEIGDTPRNAESWPYKLEFASDTNPKMPWLLWWFFWGDSKFHFCLELCFPALHLVRHPDMPVRLAAKPR